MFWGLVFGGNTYGLGHQTIVLWYLVVHSLVPRPRRPQERKRVWWHSSIFLVVLIQQPCDHCVTICKLVWIRFCIHGAHWASFIWGPHPYMTFTDLTGLQNSQAADSAQPRNRSTVTRPFSSLGGRGLVMVPRQMSFVERSSLSQRVPYQRFHSADTLQIVNMNNLPCMQDWHRIS